MQTQTLTLSPWKAYLSLTKPGIIMGNAITAASGFALASKGHFDFSLFFATLIGLSLIIASGCAFNNYIDRKADQKMPRTKNRPLAKGIISIRSANLFAIILGLAGVLFLSAFVNTLTTIIALVGFGVYVLFYSFLKYRTTHATLVGSIAGAVPPVVGYTAVTGHLDAAALLLFGIIALWQMPHFFAIAIYRLEDYAAASIPVLPVKKGIPTTKIQMLLYTVAFTIAATLLSLSGHVGKLYPVVALILGSIWICLCVQGLETNNDKIWARKMFVFSLLVVTALSAAIPLSIHFF
jgi:heme o synthase